MNETICFGKVWMTASKQMLIVTDPELLYCECIDAAFYLLCKSYIIRAVNY